MFDVKNSIVQMVSENKNLRFEWFKTVLDEAFQRHPPIKKRYVLYVTSLVILRRMTLQTTNPFGRQ